LSQRDIVVLGASAGGIEAITTILADLSADLPAAVFIVVHVAPQSPGYLAVVFDRAGPLRVQNAHQGQTFSTARAYVAPPDCHMLLGADGRILLSRGPRENRTRPAIDPLFRSAALAFGPRVIGVVLSGGLDDGCAGLRGIKMCGGTTVVQDPADAVADSMPRNALRSTDVDYCQPAGRLGQLIDKLVRTESPDAPVPLEGRRMRNDLELEAGIARGDDPRNVARLGEPSTFACPECHGTLMRLRGDRPQRYRCHTGHSFTADSLLAELTEANDQALWNAVRSAQETSILLNHLAEHWRGADPHRAQDFLRRAGEARRKADEIRDMAARHEMLSEEKLLDS